MEKQKKEIPGGHALVAQEARNRVEAQDKKWRLGIPVMFDLTPKGTDGAQRIETIKLSTEGDFSVLFMTAKIIGLDPDTGAILNPDTFGATGIRLKLQESGWGRELLRDFTALETLAVPGYGKEIHQPFPFEQVILAGSELTFDVRNVSDVRQRVALTLHGWQYRGTFRAGV